jgi:hypothetical protein
MQYLTFSVALSRGENEERHRERELGQNKINSHGLRERHTPFTGKKSFLVQYK